MRLLALPAIMLMILAACDDQRVFEKNIDLDSRFWEVSHKPAFEFDVPDSAQSYNLYCNLRNSLDYPYARIFIKWTLTDSTGAVLEKELVQHLLFNEKTGEPYGESGLGDLYDHRVPLKRDFRFPHTGKFNVSFEQYMRTDTLTGVLAVGVRLERALSTP